MNILSIGAGNMAKALIAPLAQLKDVSLTFYSPSGASAQKLAEEFSCHACSSLGEGLSSSDYCFLACKPQHLEALSKEVEGIIQDNTVVISLLAGKTLEGLQKSLKHEKVVRVMPNTPSFVGKGVSLLLSSKALSEKQNADVLAILGHTSKVVSLENEDLFDRVTTVTGSGPAYLFEFARIFKKYLQKHGLDSDQSRELVTELFLGSSLLMESEEKEDFETLRENVTSKKGMTFEALETFKREKIEETFHRALDAAYDRAQELKNV